MKGVSLFWIAYSSDERANHTRGQGSRLRLTLHHLELPGPAAAHPQVAHVARLDNIVQRLHRLFKLYINSLEFSAMSVVDVPACRCRSDAAEGQSDSSLLPPLRRAHLEDIDVVGSKTLKRSLNSGEDALR